MNNSISSNKFLADHPSTLLEPAVVADLRARSFDAEKLGQLHPEQLGIIYRQRWFNLFVPKTYGGLELDLPAALRLEEALAWTDGSLGWTVTLCSGANWFIGFLQSDAAQEIFDDPKVCLAGSGRPSGVATLTEDGYIITGSWKYATGAPHATIFTANCRIERNGKPMQDDNGEPLVQAFWFHREEVTIEENWRTIGMVATASHAFHVKDLAVPANRTFRLDPAHAILSNIVYRYPFLPFAEATLAVNYSGMALHFLELLEPVASKKQEQAGISAAAKALIQEKLLAAQQQLQEARIAFYSAVERSWEEARVKEKEESGESMEAASRSGQSLSFAQTADAGAPASSGSVNKNQVSSTKVSSGSINTKQVSSAKALSEAIITNQVPSTKGIASGEWQSAPIQDTQNETRDSEMEDSVSAVFSNSLLKDVSNTSRQLASVAKKIVDELYSFGGITAADPQSPINLVWRDLHTASQHTLLTLPQE